ncbi:MAG: hypothetical protein M1818_007235 [Claussenomyces sp. TS43310]|nr:MAG: hypothetical protein M1818_007235 [Claussenomyces sp. TS43310]
MSDAILKNLNASQKAAVSSAAQTLAILAGPGSGKTHTLTSRTAWLLRHEGLQPWNIIVATFTVKAAREMKERIGKLIGDGMEERLILGTFHSIARRYLIRYGHLIDIPKDFGIADNSDSLAVIKRIIKRHNFGIDAAATRSRISGRKAKGADGALGKGAASKTLEAQEFETCYTEYEEALKQSNLLDYDDLLLRCVDLLRSNPSCVSNVEAVLIDEFQDTNLVQFDLMRLFAAQRKRVTIVGDPDQSIYGFRSAETKNFKRMLIQYPDTLTIPLEENYRSSGAILLAALEVIRQDESRIAKSLMPTHVVGTQPVLRRLASAYTEAQWVVSEIRRCLALTGNLMTFDDIAILLRSASLSRHIESALGKSGIPYRMVGGHRFYDRVEIKILLDYLRVINQPDNNDALARIVNVPSRRIGETTVKALLEEAEQSHMALWTLTLNAVQGNRVTKTKLAKQTEQGLSSFINIILNVRDKVMGSHSSFSVVELIVYLARKLSFNDYLVRTYPEDHEARLANVQELINLATEFTAQTSNGYDDETLPEIEGLHQDGASSPLSRFLANITLASDAKNSDTDSTSKTQVTISTIHAAKGLEWPAVFIPAAYGGSIPHSRSDDVDEERRLLYVAMTRAKALLYLSYPLRNSQREQTTLSPFLSPKSLTAYLSDKGPSINSTVSQTIARILRRPLLSPTKVEVALNDLDSLEDDLWPVNVDPIEENDGRWGESDGITNRTNEQLSKRQRVDQAAINSTFRNSSRPTQWQPAYNTTMGQSASFSAVSTVLNKGFVSAGSHLQVLSKQSVSCLAETLPKSSDQLLQSGSGPSIDSEVPKVVRAASARTAKRSAGQAGITRFFSKKATVDPLTTTQDPTSCTRQEARPSTREPLVKSYSAPARVNLSGAITPAPPDVLPSLGNHRLGSAQLRAPPKQTYDDETPAKSAYVFLSSSPQAAEGHKKDVEDTTPNIELPAKTRPEAGVKLPREATNRSRPVQTIHVPSMTGINTLNAPRKTLGVRRSMKGWSDRMNRDCNKPTVSKSP